MLKAKLIYILGSLALVAAAGGTYRMVTGECPLAAVCHAIHGDKAATQVVADKPNASN